LYKKSIEVERAPIFGARFFMPDKFSRASSTAQRSEPLRADFSAVVWGGRQKMERKFLVLLRRYRLLKEQPYFNIFVCSFLRPCGETRRFLSAFGGSSKPRGFVYWW